MGRSRLRASTGAVGFVFLGGPTLVAGLVPWLVTRWHADEQPPALRILGGVLLVLGAALILETTARFALQGRGTPAPWAPPERFVARGSYRFMRNPMYVGVLALIAGQGLLLGREILFAWAALAWLLFHAFVVYEEEPGLRRRFGAEYEDYCARVARWLPTAPRSPRYSRRRRDRPARRSQ
ncbi:MAG TPA: isoprenylcysteine carboxylmethyltransferase family protein [Gaiellaceae bacterium]|nr:isoprenylcysteine carboxylmethyltransferase family protein [Gaiellaceae bacterium]